jgi:hypothetical protein
MLETKQNCRNLSSSLIPPLHNMVQNKATGDDDTVSILDCVYENLSEVDLVTVTMKLAIRISCQKLRIKYLMARVAYHTVNKVTGKQLKL